MSNPDLTNIADTVLSQQEPEKKITEYKIFYKTHLTRIANREKILNKLIPFCVELQKSGPKNAFLTTSERSTLEREAEETLKKYFSSEVLKLYHKELPVLKQKRQTPNVDDSFWLKLLNSFAVALENMNEQYKQEWTYKTNFLTFLCNCLYHYGLHPDILRRDPHIYKRYNFLLEHYFKSRKMIIEKKILLKPDVLQHEYLNPYEKKLPIKIGGKLIPFKNIYAVKITSSLLLDDEIALFAAKNQFAWNSQTKDEINFIRLCQDETDDLLKNPYLLNELNREKLRNQHTCFVHPKRIEELLALKRKKFDLSKLIQLCTELNNASAANNLYAPSILVRAIIDHVPPIFGVNSFSELANNYSDGTKSFKKAMQTLNNSLRNIADDHIHSQARSKEALPTTTQIDFTPELDFLLGEIIRRLK